MKDLDKTEYNFYNVKFSNNEEKFILTPLDKKTKEFLSELQQGMMDTSFLQLKQINTERERNPVFHSKSSIISVEKISPSIIGNNNKLWKVL